MRFWEGGEAEGGTLLARMARQVEMLRGGGEDRRGADLNQRKGRSGGDVLKIAGVSIESCCGRGVDFFVRGLADRSVLVAFEGATDDGMWGSSHGGMLIGSRTTHDECWRATRKTRGRCWKGSMRRRRSNGCGGRRLRKCTLGGERGRDEAEEHGVGRKVEVELAEAGLEG